jgi:hypothetical protein
MTEEQKAERLAAERGRLEILTSPVAKTQSYIVISEILLDFAGTAMSQGDLAGMGALLDQYSAAITSARDTIWDSDRDPLRDPEGYKDLELSLRAQIRRLQEMSRTLNLDDRQPIEAALARAGAARDDMIKKLFPQPANEPLHFSN